MARLIIVAVAGRLPGWADAACAEYLKRMPRGYEAQRVAVKPEPRSAGRRPAQLLAAEAKRIAAALPPGALQIALDERGSELTTAQFAPRLRAWLSENAGVAFVIGGADGLDAGVLRASALRLRLSSFTLPHALAQVLLCEQLYRAASLLTGHPYHRA
ncbi:MAG TPA: 23S rRNA (pseudouridine(1915)-N(3))-methyltransferase RlmH [Burkholderiales bacterium]|nr:23S rRNA (pseudouridine(1915)-N(3))-methyltransferase RlmH [Burkholderiales bacterium]